MKGLEKDRTRRYESAGALGRDTGALPSRRAGLRRPALGVVSPWRVRRRIAGRSAWRSSRRHRWSFIAVGSLVAGLSLHQALGNRRNRCRGGRRKSRQAAATAINSEKEAESRLYSSLFEQAGRAVQPQDRAAIQSLDALDKAIRVAVNLASIAEHRLELRQRGHRRRCPP